MSKGWVKIWREDIENNPCWPGKRKQPFTKMEAWLDLSIVLAQTVDTATSKKGQVEVSIRFLSKRWQWTLPKVHRWLKKFEKFGYLKIESPLNNRSKKSIITMFRPSRTVTQNVTQSVTDKALNQKGLFPSTVTQNVTQNVTPPLHALTHAEDPPPKIKREATLRHRAEDGPDECANRILDHCLAKGPWKGFQVQKSEDAARVRIIKRLESGYTEKDLIHYVDVYLGRRRAHQRFKNSHDGEEPSPRDRLWCPNPTWSIAQLFTREGYFVKWIDDKEEVLTLERMERIEDQEYETY